MSTGVKIRFENQSLVAQIAKLQAEVALLERDKNGYRIGRDAAVAKNAELQAEALAVRAVCRTGRRLILQLGGENQSVVSETLFEVFNPIQRASTERHRACNINAEV